MPEDTPGSAPPSHLDPTAITSRQEFADELNRLRERAGLSVRDLARATDLARSTVGGYLNGRHLPPVTMPEVLPDILRACGVTDRTEVQRWCDALGTVRRLPGPRPAAAAAPYRGLASFQPEDSEWFFGRDRLTVKVVDGLAERWRAGAGPIAVVGPSGSGKSSLLRAGVIPALREGELPVDGSAAWPVLLFHPGTSPVAALAGELSRLTGASAEVIAAELRARPARCADVAHDAAGKAGGLFIVVDQFEEVFTECDDDERQVFLVALHAAAASASTTQGPHRPPAVVLLGLRADFYHRALRDPTLAAVLDEAQVALGPMNEAELREAIVAPAHKAGLDVEDGLVEVLLRDLAPPGGGAAPGAHEAGALPLLSHALRATWERGTRWRLTVADYRATGGVRGAVAKTADAVYESLTDGERDLARRMFVQLVRVGEDTPNTRRRLTYREFDQLVDDPRAGALRDVLDRFVDARLVTVHADAVEVTHEALVAAWPRLRDWVDTDRRRLLTRQRLDDAAQLWDREGRDPALLYRGTRLVAAQEWAQATGHRELTVVGREFLQASVARQRRGARMLTQTVAALAALSLLAVSGGIFALQQRATVAQERNIALSRMVAVNADRLQGVDPALAAQLAVGAHDLVPTVEARSSLLSASAVPEVTRLLGPSAIMQDLALSQRRGLLAGASDDDASVLLWDVSDPHAPARLANTLPGLRGVVNEVAFHPEGRILAAGGTGGEVQLYDVTDPADPVRLDVRLTGPGDAINAVAFSPDGRVLAAGTVDAAVHLWDVTDLTAPVSLGEPLEHPEESVASVAFDPDGRILVAGVHDGTVHRWDLTDPAGPAPLGEALAGPQHTVYSVAFGPDGRTVAAASADESVYLWDVTDPSTGPGTVLSTPSGSGWVHSVAVSPDGRRVAGGSGDGQARVWDLASGQVVNTLPHPGPVTGLAFEPDGAALYAAAADGNVRRWTLPGPVLAAAAGIVFDLVHHPRAPIVVAASGDGHLYLWDVSDPQRPALVADPVASPDEESALVGTIGISPDGTTLVAAGRDGTTWRWDISDPARPTILDPPLSGLPTFAERLVFSGDGRILAGGDTTGHVQLWDLTDPAEPRALATMAEGPGHVFSIAFSPDGRTLAVGGVDRVVWLWDISQPDQPRQLAEPLTGPTSYVYSVAFSPDGDTLAVGSADETVRLWDTADPTRPRAGPVLTGAKGYVLWVAFSPDGRQLAAASRDHTIRLWDLSDADQPALHAVLSGHQGGVNMVAYHPDGHTLASSSNDTTVRLWRLDAEGVAADLCAVTGDPLTAHESEQYLPGLAYQPPCGVR